MDFGVKRGKKVEGRFLRSSRLLLREAKKKEISTLSTRFTSPEGEPPCKIWGFGGGYRCARAAKEVEEDFCGKEKGKKKVGGTNGGGGWILRRVWRGGRPLQRTDRGTKLSNGKIDGFISPKKKTSHV